MKNDGQVVFADDITEVDYGFEINPEQCLGLMVNDNKTIHLDNVFARYVCSYEHPNQPGVVFFGDNERMSKKERLALYFALADITQEDQIFRPLSISLNEMCKSLHMKLNGTKDYEGWYQAVFALSRRRLMCLKSGRFVVSSPYFSTCSIDLQSKRIILKLNPDLSQYFLNIYRNKTVFKFGFFRQLNSTYSMDFYPFCSSMKNGNRAFLMSVDQLKMKIGYTQDTKYFLSEVLIPSLYEINMVTDLDVKIQYVRTGRQITDIRFFVREKTISEQKELGINVEGDRAPVKIRANASTMRDSVLLKDEACRKSSKDIIL